MTPTSEPPALESTGRRAQKAPGWLWIAILGAVGFAAGFFGPMVFVPEANQGPMVGIFITGPGGALLGLILFVLMKFLPVPARVQWGLLTVLCVAGSATILLVVQPEPARLGDLVEFEITSTRTPAQSADEVVTRWRKRFAEVTWTAPREGWEPEMRRTLGQDQGMILDTILVRRRQIMEHRKPWNRGRLAAAEWKTVEGPYSVYLPAAYLASIRVGAKVQLFIPNDTRGGIKAPDAWPPHEFHRIIGLSVCTPVPAAYQEFQ